MLGTARLTGQSLGAVILGVTFSAAGVREGGTDIALGLAAVLAAAAAAFSLLRVRAV
jgi:DHA2 family multidrug resistance protein-like MFS transporter